MLIKHVYDELSYPMDGKTVTSMKVIGPTRPANKSVLIHAEMPPLKAKVVRMFKFKSKKANPAKSPASKKLHSFKVPKKAGDGAKVERYMLMHSTKETSGKTLDAAIETPLKGMVMTHFTSLYKLFKRIMHLKFSKFCVALTTLIVASLLFMTCLAIYFVGNAPLPLVYMDIRCKMRYGKCAFYRKKYVLDCSATSDFCNTIEMIVDLKKESIQGYGGSRMKAELIFRMPTDSELPTTISEGAPCLMPGKQHWSSDALGLCKNGQCDATISGYDSRSVINGSWTDFAGVNVKEEVPCLNMKKLPSAISKYMEGMLVCQHSTLCPAYYLQFRSCENPTPALGGHGCVKNVTFAASSDYPLRISLCPDCALDGIQCNASQRCEFEAERDALSSLDVENSDDAWFQREKHFQDCCTPNREPGVCFAGTCFKIDRRK